jgi:thymidylate synthase ThyX|tara:strand:+ start:28 stop:1629 length:1602 start_codon:yes stop_codon:yes gene_type:complete
LNNYATEQFTPSEEDILRRYFTNLDQPVFALVNLPEVVKGALFARYSRTHKSLRRLFLDEFVDDLDISGDHSIDATVGLAKAEELYQRVFVEYGDDSVAQLGGVHLACEQASNLLTKVLEWGRLMSYLEQSTRYLSYDTRIDGRYRYHRDPEILGASVGTKYVGEMDRIFETYAELVPLLQDFYRSQHEQGNDIGDLAYRQTIRAKAFDAVRGLLPAASLSNVGIYGTGQAYEALLLRMRAHPLPEARSYSEMMLAELRKVIPSFLRRVDVEERGIAWSDYLEKNYGAMKEFATTLTQDLSPNPAQEVELIDWDPDGERKMLAAMLYPYSHLPETQLVDVVDEMAGEQRLELVRRYVGDRANRRHRPGRALERLDYRFDVLGDYGGFRDLQRHRLLTIEWQALTPDHGYEIPGSVLSAGLGERYDGVMERSRALYDLLLTDFPVQASYAVSMAFRVRYIMQFNAREALHMIELRSQPQGHPNYRRIAQEMYHQIAQKAGHRAVAEMFTHIDLSAGEDGRLQAEKALEAKRSAQ